MKIAITLIPEALSSTVTGPADVLITAALLAGLPWQLDMVAEHEQTVSCFNGIALTASRVISSDVQYDLILIPSLVISQKGLQADHSKLINWLREQSAHGATIATICTGAFLLAETGLLDGRQVTTHWAFVDAFRRLYPSILLEEKKTIVDSGTILCCSAGTAWQDLVLYILQQYVDEAVILQLSETFQLQRHNTGQQAFCGLPVEIHADASIEKAKRVLKEKLQEADVIEQAIHASGLTSRTFQRRFKAITQMTAGRYLQLLRVDKAKQLLIFDTLPIEQVSYQVGYEDTSYMRRLFKKETGLSMREYRQRFAAL